MRGGHSNGTNGRLDAKRLGQPMENASFDMGHHRLPYERLINGIRTPYEGLMNGINAT
jgi:hypothetical protein